MANKLVTLATLFFFCIATFVSSQVQEGTPCETPDEVYGLCVSIYRCDVLINLLQSQSNNPQVVSYLRSSTCGYLGRTPMVCCPQTGPKTSSPLTEPVTQDPTDPQLRNPNSGGSSILRPPNCGRQGKSGSRVVGGHPADLGEFPWVVALGYKNSKDPNSPKWLCGGTLITDKHILTAAHCVYNRNDLYVAKIGDLDLNDDNDNANPVQINLIKAKIHDDYSNAKHINDIAILTLAQKVDITEHVPVCLPVDSPLKSDSFLGKQAAVAGWGSLYFNGPSSSALQTVTIPVIDNNNCERSYGSSAVIDGTILCAGELAGGKDSCKGDSGGPLMTGVKDKTNGTIRIFYQIGVVSYGFKCAEAGYPGVYTRVTEFVDWIANNLN